MTERRPGQERRVGQAGSGARAPHDRAPEQDVILGLQEQAGNRAVADLLAGRQAASRAPSAGLRVRDLLRGMRPPALATIQRQPPGGQEAYWEAEEAAKEAWTEAAARKSWDEKSAGGEGAFWKDLKSAAWDERSASDEKSAGGEEKGSGPVGATPMLAVGSAGPAVARLQALLAMAGFAVTPDGIYGPRTRAAVVTFQAGQGLAPDGIVGPRTWSALEAPGSARGGEGPGGLVSPGELELVRPGREMEKAGSVEGGAGEATLSDENARKKESVGAWE